MVAVLGGGEAMLWDEGGATEDGLRIVYLQLAGYITATSAVSRGAVTSQMLLYCTVYCSDHPRGDWEFAVILIRKICAISGCCAYGEVLVKPAPREPPTQHVQSTVHALTCALFEKFHIPQHATCTTHNKRNTHTHIFTHIFTHMYTYISEFEF